MDLCRFAALQKAVPPSFGKAPDPRRGELDAVAGRIAQVERAAAARPALLVLDRHARGLEPRPPGIERRLRHGEADVARARRTVRWRHTLAGRGPRVEEEEHRPLETQEEEHARPLALDLEAQEVDVEPSRGLEVVGIETGLEDVADLCQDSSPGGGFTEPI